MTLEKNKSNIGNGNFLLSCREYVLVPVREAEAFMERSIVAVGAKSSHAKDLATLLACADYRGHYSHGMNRLSKL